MRIPAGPAYSGFSEGGGRGGGGGGTSGQARYDMWGRGGEE